jgi:hypothetical protein
VTSCNHELIYHVFGAGGGGRNLSLWNLEFDPKSVYVGFLVDEVVLGQVVFRAFQFSSDKYYYMSVPTTFIHLKPTPYNLSKSYRR